MSIQERFFEKRWLKRLNRGDHEAFLELYDAYVGRVFRHVRLRTPSREIAEDITSQVFVNTWEYILRAKSQLKAVKGFLFRTANNLLTDFYRTRAREISTEDDYFLEIPVSGDLVEKADRRHQAKAIHMALKALPTQYQTLLIWRYIDELSINEIARLTQKSKDSVYVSIHRALKTLGKTLEKNSKSL